MLISPGRRKNKHNTVLPSQLPKPLQISWPETSRTRMDVPLSSCSHKRLQSGLSGPRSGMQEAPSETQFSPFVTWGNLIGAASLQRVSVYVCVYSSLNPSPSDPLVDVLKNISPQWKIGYLDCSKILSFWEMWRVFTAFCFPCSFDISKFLLYFFGCSWCWKWKYPTILMKDRRLEFNLILYDASNLLARKRRHQVTLQLSVNCLKDICNHKLSRNSKSISNPQDDNEMASPEAKWPRCSWNTWQRIFMEDLKTPKVTWKDAEVLIQDRKCWRSLATQYAT